MDYEAVIRLFTDQYTADLVDRHVEALGRVARANAAGFLIADMPYIRDILELTFRAISELGEAYVPSLCELLSLFAKPYRRAKAHEEYSSSAALGDILRLIVEATVWDIPQVQLAAAQTLLTFVEAQGFDSAAKAAAAEGRQSSWQFHQQLLRESELVEPLVMAFRSHVTRFLDVSSRSDAAAMAVVADASATAAAAQQRGQQTALGVTLAVRAAGVTRVPDAIVLLGRLLREVSEDADNAVVLTRAGLPQLCTALMARVENLLEPLLQTVVETLWNLLEHSAIKASAIAEGRTGEAALSLAELVDKHRSSNAVRMLAAPPDALAIRTMLERCLLFGYTQAEKELRNDVVCVATLLARKPENRPVFASTGLLHVLLTYATAAEMHADTEAPLANYATPSAQDLEFKRMAWFLITMLCQGSYADQEAPSVDAQSGEGDTAPSCLAVVRESPFLYSMLVYLDPRQRTHPYLSLWSPAQLRSLQLQALHLLTILGPLFAPQLVQAEAPAILVDFLRQHTDVLHDRSPGRGGSEDAGSKDSEDADDYGFTAGGSKTASAPQSAVTATRAGSVASKTAAAAPVSPGAASAEHDAGRQYAVLCALHALAELGVRSDPASHLSAMVTAGVPTVVAPRMAGSRASGAASTAESATALSVSLCVALGDLGLLEDLVTLLKHLPDGGEDTTDGDGLNQSGFTKMWTGTAASKAAPRSILESTGYGQGITEVTPAMMISEGRSVVPPALLKEQVLALMAALTKGAADAAAVKAALALHQITQVSPPAAATSAAAAVTEQARSARSASPSPESSPVRPQASVTSSTGSPLAGLQENQVRLRKVGGVSAILRVLKRCVQDARKRSIGEFASSTVRPRVATAGLWALRCCTLGNVRSEARFLAEGGIDVLLDLAEVGPATLKPLAVTVLADMSRNPISHVCVQCWRSDISGHSAGRLLLQMWADEEARLGVVHEDDTGMIANPSRPLDGGDAATRQLAIFTATHTPTAAAVKDIVPGGRKSLLVKPGEKTRRGSPVGDGGGGGGGDVAAFRALRRALRAAKLWQHVESKVPGGALASHVAGMDLRHKLFAALHAFGFQALDEEVHSSGAEGKEGKEADVEGSKAAEHEDDGMEFLSPLIAQARAEREAEAAAARAGSKSLAFPDLTPLDKVKLELARYYPDFVVGAAYDDVRTRLAELSMDPVNEDAAELARQLESCRSAAQRARALQSIQVKHRNTAQRASEEAYLTGIIARKTAEEEALRFAERNARRPWAAAGKTNVSLSMDERKIAMAERARMLSSSYVGYKPFPGAEHASTDEAPAAENGGRS